MIWPRRSSTLFPYTTLFRSCIPLPSEMIMPFAGWLVATGRFSLWGIALAGRSEEHTSELQSRFDLVCRLLLEKKKLDKPEHICIAPVPRHQQHVLLSQPVVD